MNLSDQQVDMLVHRLEVPDAICDALDADYEVVFAACDRMRKYILNYRMLPDAEALNHMDKAVLGEAVEGSTWFGASLQSSSRMEVTKAMFDVKRVESFVSEVIGRNVKAPRW